MRKIPGYVMAIALFLFMGVALLYRDKPNQSEDSQFQSDNKQPKREERPISADDLLRMYKQKKEDNLLRLVVHQGDMKIGGFGDILIGNFVVRNNGDFDAKDIKISCKLSSETHTPLSSVSAIAYKFLGRNSSIKIKKLNFGFISHHTFYSSCLVSDFEYDLDAMTKNAQRR